MSVKSLENINVILIGASAGGVKSIERLLEGLENIPPHTKASLCIIVLQHLSEEIKSLMKEIIERGTPSFDIESSDSEVLRGGLFS